MEINDAIRELRRVQYKPEWRTRFAFAPGVLPGTLDVGFEIRPVNTAPRHIDPREWVIADGSYNLPVGLARNVEELHRMNLDAIIREIETHEAREAYRVDGVAPFHPHRIDGRARWDRRERAVAA